jgi:hypothetical protein
MEKELEGNRTQPSGSIEVQEADAIAKLQHDPEMTTLRVNTFTL